MMTSYIIEFSTLLLLSTLLYHFILRENKNYLFLRLYILGSVLGSLLIPLLPSLQSSNISVIEPILPMVTISSVEVLGSGSEIEQASSKLSILLLVYAIGAGIFLIKFIRSLSLVCKLINQGQKSTIDNIDVIFSKYLDAPCSVFNHIIIPAGNRYDTETLETIVQHEAYHIEYGHTSEKIFLELLKVILWFHPAIWYLKNEL